MTSEPIFYDEKKHSYYILGLPKCDGCFKEQSSMIRLSLFWRNKKRGLSFKHCQDCSKQKQKVPVAFVKETYWCKVINFIPKNVKPVLLIPPTPQKSRLDVYSAYDLMSVSTSDRTRHALRESSFITADEVEALQFEARQLTQQLDRPLNSDRRAFEHLEALQQAEHLIEEKPRQKDLLEAVK